MTINWTFSSSCLGNDLMQGMVNVLMLYMFCGIDHFDFILLRIDMHSVQQRHGESCNIINKAVVSCTF